MITLICATNRPGSNSSKVARFYQQRLEAAGVDHHYFSLEDFPQDLLNNDMYKYNTHADLVRIQDEVLKPATKFIFVMPEYNGSFPGVLKAFIDSSDIAACWHNKKACMVGVAAGRAGNLRGMEHFTNILGHIKIDVLHLKIPISGVGGVLDEDGNISVPEIVSLIDEQIGLLQNF